MVTGINEFSILVTALLSVAVGSIWYSPLLFGEAWMRAIGFSSGDVELPRPRVIRLVAAGILGNIVFFFVLARFINLAGQAGVSLWSFGTLLIALISALLVCLVLWEKRPLSYFAIHIGYAALIIYGGITVIAYWPW